MGEVPMPLWNPCPVRPYRVQFPGINEPAEAEMALEDYKTALVTGASSGIGAAVVRGQPLNSYINLNLIAQANAIIDSLLGN